MSTVLNLYQSNWNPKATTKKKAKNKTYDSSTNYQI